LPFGNSSLTQPSTPILLHGGAATVVIDDDGTGNGNSQIDAACTVVTRRCVLKPKCAIDRNEFPLPTLPERPKQEPPRPEVSEEDCSSTEDSDAVTIVGASLQDLPDLL